MFINDLYVTIVRRPLQGHAGTFDALHNALLRETSCHGETACWAAAKAAPGSI